jgi:orotate phosphoribosyltransferase
LHYLATWWDVLAALRDDDAISEQTVASVETFLHDPKGWSAANGGK